jgi:hypothetical protein
MSHTYLLDTYAFIERRLEEIQRQMAAAGHDDWKTRQRAAGRIQALNDLERFLSANYDAKLPRRLARRRR